MVQDLLYKHLDVVCVTEEQLLFDTTTTSGADVSVVKSNHLLHIPRTLVKDAYNKNVKLWNCATLFPEYTIGIQLGVLECTTVAHGINSAGCAVAGGGVGCSSSVVELLVILQEDGDFDCQAPDISELPLLNRSEFDKRVAAATEKFNLPNITNTHSSFESFTRSIVEGCWMKDASGVKKLFQPA